MESDRWRRVNDIFQAAIALTGDRRQAFVLDACGGDERLRRQLERLLEAHHEAGRFLETPILPDAIRQLAGRDWGVEGSTSRRDEAGDNFRGTHRFRVIRRLGAGGMGVVYEAHDRMRDEIVALKTLRRATASDIYRFKKEFRGLADVAHPNLVCLYELVVEGGDCFFTMEMVPGVTLVEHVGWPPQFDRIRRVLPALVAGVAELHRYGKLHRDIKPSNVMVTPEGRVVILDFGLTRDTVPDGDTGELIAGTPAYMAPELHPGARATEASDWYSVGATLYEALTGRVPFDGPALRRKRDSDPAPPAVLSVDVPCDLSAACMGLLCRDPARRPSGSEALRQLLPAWDVPRNTVAPAVRRQATDFVGRVEQLETLRRALATARAGCAVTVYVRGPSGIGKTALAREFLAQVGAHEQVVVLRGRCYEHESVPYKALDGVIDSLSHYMRTLTPTAAAALLPVDVPALARVFPVLRRVQGVDAESHEEADSQEPFVLRQRAFAALRELLSRIADRQPLIVFIDDLHWADADSAVLLDDLFRAPCEHPLLLLACVRDEEVRTTPFLEALLDRATAGAGITLSLGPLTDREVSDAIASLVPGSGVTQADKLIVARESAGNPFLLEQLARDVAENRARSDDDWTFAHVLERRLRTVPPHARRLLEMLAVCGRPMTPELLFEAASVTGDGRPLVALLRAGHLLRGSGSAGKVEIYHDRIRETIAAQLPLAEIQLIHRALLRTMLASRVQDPETLFEHYLGAGDITRAAGQAARAGANAEAALAFDRAAFLYRQALDLAPAVPDAGGWKEALAQSLANAGRPAEAARVYLDAATQARQARRVELHRRAAEQFLIGGHIDVGFEVMRTVLREVGIRLPRSPRMAVASLVWHRARLWVRGLSFVERRAEDVPAETQLRMDTCWSVCTGIGMVDVIRAADFHARFLLLALDAGQSSRIARGLALEAGFIGGRGGDWEHAVPVAARAVAMARAAGDRHTVALVTGAAGFASMLGGQWKKASHLMEQALTMLNECIGATWESNSMQDLLLSVLVYQGEIREVSRRLPLLLATAQERGNLYLETTLSTRAHIVWLAADDPGEAERRADAVMARWSHQGFHRQHLNHLGARVHAQLYRGNSDAAWQLLADKRPALLRAFLLRLQIFRIEASYLRARCALSMARHEPGGPFIAVATREAARIARERMPWSNPLALLLRAAIAFLAGDRVRAEGALAAAVDGFDRADMALHAAVARRRLGEVLDSDAGRELRRRADAWMAAQDIRDPTSLTRLIAPGFPDDDGR